MIPFDKRVCGPKHVKEILVRRFLEAGVIKNRDAKGSRQWVLASEFSLLEHPCSVSQETRVRLRF